jgi:hypothetical protein
MKPHQLRVRPKWDEQASRAEINEVAGIDRLIGDLRRRRGTIINCVSVRMEVWLTHHPKRKRG